MRVPKSLSVTLGLPFLGSYFVLSTTFPFNSLPLCWTSGPVLVGQSILICNIFYVPERLLVLPLVDNTFLFALSCLNQLKYVLTNLPTGQ